MADARLAASLVRMRQRRTGPLILELDLTDGIAEGPPSDPVTALLTMRKTRLQDLLEGLRRAAADDRVRVLVVKVGGSRIGLAKVQELRAAIGDFRRSGKLAVAWAESFGDFVHGNVPYYLATGFDRSYLQPSGTLGLTGVAVEQVFLHGALEKLGIDFEAAKRHEYKSAPEQLTESGFTGPAREATARLAESVTEQLAGVVAAGRGLSVEQATDLLGRGPFLAPQALAEGLVDGLMYRDEVYDQVRKEAGQDATLLYLQRYQRTQSLSDLPRRLGSSVQGIAPGQHERFVATIYAHGAIMHGRSGRGGTGGGRGRRGGPRRRAPGQQPGRLVHGVRRDLARGGQAPGGRQARHRLDGGRGGVRRVLHLGARGRDRGAARNEHRVHRGLHGEAGAARAVRAGRADDRLDHGRSWCRERDDVLLVPAVLRGRVGAGQRVARRRLRGFHGEGGVWATDARRASARARARPGVDRRRRDRQRACRRGRRPARGGRDRPQAGRAARGRARADLPSARPARPVAAR